MLRTALVLGALALYAGPAAAGFTITENLDAPNGIISPTVAVGQSFTTPTGGPWNQITFNFFTPAAATPVAARTLYLLDREYLGRPVDLSSATPGFLGTGTATSDGVYVFDIGLRLMPQTQYFVYTNAAIGTNIKGRSSGGYTGGALYHASPSSDFVPSLNGNMDALFRVQGEVAGQTPIAAPEPASLTLGLLGAGGLFALRRRLA